MGYLTIDGRALTYEESRHLQEKIKKKGIQQFYDLFKIYKEKTCPEVYEWGYEIEY